RIEIKRNEVTEHTRTLSKAGMREWRKRRLKAMLMSSVVPGGGQFVSKQYIRGGLYASVFIGSIAMVYLARQDHTDAKSEYNDAMTAYHQLEDQAVLSRHLSQARSAWEDMNSAEDRLNMIMFTAGGLYALQIIDTWIWGGGKRPVAGKFSSKVKLQPYAALDLDYVKVGVNLCWI
ncbi:MAG: DUF5683 domain-containing protein, partial [Candidatus Hatepunaea meridiana]|nr:DUF5683 domain-containing protein [Candidatus Hatepunaea meridiana]